MSSGWSASDWRTRSERAPAAPASVSSLPCPIPSVPVRCVEVDSLEHLYLAGRSMVPTHNSTMGLDIAGTQP